MRYYARFVVILAPGHRCPIRFVGRVLDGTAGKICRGGDDGVIIIRVRRGGFDRLGVPSMVEFACEFGWGRGAAASRDGLHGIGVLEFWPFDVVRCM